jgi:hypothetical protein
MLASYRISHSVVAQRSLGGAKQTKQKADARPNARHHLLSLLLVRIITPTYCTIQHNYNFSSCADLDADQRKEVALYSY